MRCFVALPLPAELCKQVAVVQEQAKKTCRDADVRWTAPATLHLTLKFLGEVSAERLDPIRDALAACAAGHRIPRLTLAGVGAFPSPRRARVVWLGVTDGTAELVDLAGAIDRVLAPLGFELEPHPFTAHLTIGRVHAPRRGADLTIALTGFTGAEVGSWTPHAVVLYESHLRAGGAVHEVRAECPLG